MNEETHPQNNRPRPTEQRIEWLAVLRGLNIVLVVMFHVQLVDLSTGLNHPFCEWISSPFDPLRMPLFIFISGGLLYLSRIRKGWNTQALYADKTERILIPFLFFVVVYYAVKSVVGSLVKTPVNLSLDDFLLSFVYYVGRPTAPLWFLPTLMTLMIMYPVYCRLCRSWQAMTAALVAASLLFFVETDPLSSFNVFNVLNLHHYLIYFLAGIAFFRFRLWQRLNSRRTLCLTTLLYILLLAAEHRCNDVTGYSVLTDILFRLVAPLTGIAMGCSAAMLTARRWPDLFASYREYIYQIYLMSLPFQAFVELVLWRRLFYCEPLFPLFYVLNVAAGVWLPVCVTKMVERCNWRPLQMCFGVKKRVRQQTVEASATVLQKPSAPEPTT